MTKKQKPVRIVSIADKPALSPAEAATLSGFGRRTLYREMSAGRLIARKNGARTVILRTDLDRWLAAMKPVQASAPAFQFIVKRHAA